MKSNLTSLIKKVFFSSVAGILSHDTTHAGPSIEFTTLENNDHELAAHKILDLSPKLLLKQNKNSQWFVMAHRSHRSHSSHRSHYSSTSGSTTRSTSSPTRSSGSSTNSSSSSSNSTTSPYLLNTNSVKVNSGLSATTLKLGDRNLKLGMSGSDVTQLINILIKKGYLKLENQETQVTGSYTYDETIEAVVKQYQKDKGLVSDGTCGVTTTYYLLQN